MIKNHFMKEESKERSLEELQKSSKDMRALIFIVGGLIIAYLLYFGFSLYNGTWKANNLIGITPIGLLVIVNSGLSVRFASLQKEIKAKEKGK